METNLNDKLAIVDNEDLVNGEIDLSIKKAYGDDGLGILYVKNVPGLVEARSKLLPLAYQVAKLSEEDKNKITYEKHFFALGWSHGKEKFLGKPDVAKGSFYAPPLSKDSDIISTSGDKPWPEKIPEFKEAFQGLGKIIVDCGTLLASHIDKFVLSQCPDYKEGWLEKTIKDSDKHLARLLHYFPQEKNLEGGPWCGIHNDHDCLTGLTSALYTDKEGDPTEFNEVDSGLHILGRDNKEYKASIPADCIAFQIGETMQIQSGGLLKATPHFVKSGDDITGTGISRNTLAVFMQPKMEEQLEIPKSSSYEKVCTDDCDKVPKLSARFTQSSMTFGEFHMATIQYFSPPKKPAEMVDQ